LTVVNALMSCRSSLTAGDGYADFINSSVYIHYLKIISWVRFQFFCISFVSSSHQYRARPCLPSLILDPSISNNNLIRLNLIK
jgi:hypothetical protein